MEEKLTFTFFLVLFSIALFLPVGRVLSQDQLEWNITCEIKVYEDGSAAWTIERSAVLETAEDVANFYYYASPTYLKKFKNGMLELVEKASNSTGRNMSAPATHFNLTASISETGSASVIKYRFYWIGFAEVQDERIAVGDAFVEGFNLHQYDVLIIEYPSDHIVVTALPLPDRTLDQALMWYGHNYFELGEPTLILSKRNVSWSYLPLIVGISVAVAGIGFSSLWFFKFRKREEEVGLTAQKIKLGVEDEDEEKVVKLLKQAGGPMYQSAITKHFGFSKSKTSQLLAAMEKEGLVRRQKKGREKLVTLADKD